MTSKLQNTPFGGSSCNAMDPDSSSNSVRSTPFGSNFVKKLDTPPFNFSCAVDAVCHTMAFPRFNFCHTSEQSAKDRDASDSGGNNGDVMASGMDLRSFLPDSSFREIQTKARKESKDDDDAPKRKYDWKSPSQDAEQHEYLVHPTDSTNTQCESQVETTHTDKANTLGGNISPDATINQSSPSWKLGDVVKLILSFAGMVLYVVDVFSDVWQSVNFFVSGEITYGAVTLAFVVVSYIVTAAMGLHYYIANYNSKEERLKAHPFVWFCRILSTILMLGPFTRALEYLYNHIKFHTTSKSAERDAYSKRMDEHDQVNCMLRGFEACFEAAPQLTFQLYVVLVTKPQLGNAFDLVRWVTILSSWFSLCSALMSFYAFFRLRDSKADNSNNPPGAPSRKPMNLRHKVFYLIWRLPETAVRVLCIACFASVFKYTVLAILVPHVVIMIGWQWLHDKMLSKKMGKRKRQEEIVELQSTVGQTERNGTEESEGQDRIRCIILYVVFGYAFLFAFFDKYGGRNFRLRCIAFYTLFYAENFTMLLVWYFYTPDQTAWFHNVILILGCVLLPLHVSLQLFYNKCCHPDDSILWETWKEALFENMQDTQQLKPREQTV